jgi:serine/threonine-protein phosphatase 2A regulatory subunit B'
MAQFKSPDPRERDYLKTILHRAYGKFMVHRSFIRKSIMSQLLKTVYDDSEDRFGHSEFLEILGSIIAGFAVPLKGEHRAIFEKCLIQIHRANHVQSFHQQLVQCIITYLEKD